MKWPRTLTLAAMILIVSGCSLFQPKDDSTTTKPTIEIVCEWTSMRGVAELVRFEDNSAVMDFFPGDIRFRTDVDNPDWRPGDEFKVLLETPDHPDCGESRVRELSPVGPDA